jgi:MoaA/NifB/PqqE/SkfB family radical SAM enzyme
MANDYHKKRDNHAVIRLTESCNLACSICYRKDSLISRYSNQEKNHSVRDIKELIKQYHLKGFETIRFTGGEPTLEIKLFDYISYAKLLGFKKIMISSNGLKISKKDYCKKLSMMGLNKANISIHGSNAVEHDNITKLKGSYNKSLKAIKNLIHFKIHVAPTVTVNSLNYKNLNKIIYDLHKLNINQILFFYILPIGRVAENKEIVVPYNLSSIYLNRALEYAKKNKCISSCDGCSLLLYL